MIEVSHPDYHAYPDNSTGFEIRSVPQSGYFSDGLERAKVFRMHRKGNPVPLIFRAGGFHAPVDGSAAKFPLRGKTQSQVISQSEIQGWKDVQSQSGSPGWTVRLALSDGSIIESTNQFGFVAPEAGYSGSLDIEVSGSDAGRRTHFFRTPAGYARFKLEVTMGRDMFVVGEYYFNPDGSRNLEPDPSRMIRPTQY